MKLKEQNPALLLIDIQKGFEDETYWGGSRNNKMAEGTASQLLNTWRKLKLPIFHIVHSSQNPNSPLHESHPGFEIKNEVKPMAGEPVIKKKVNSAFIGTELKTRLDEKGIKKLILVGLTTDHCVSTTARMAANLGFDTFVVFDATATFNKRGVDGQNYSAELIHETALASLNGEFATIVTAAELIEALI
jgi:nicotinamidase-related amidase